MRTANVFPDGLIAGRDQVDLEHLGYGWCRVLSIDVAGTDEVAIIKVQPTSGDDTVYTLTVPKDETLWIRYGARRLNTRRSR